MSTLSYPSTTHPILRESGEAPAAAPLGLRSGLLFFVAAALLVFAMSMHKTLDVDENGFIASGALLARHGTLPYRDYHYNHMPTEVMVYALLFKLSGHLLLVARWFQSMCAAGAATALFVAAYGAFDELPGRTARLGWSAAIGGLLLANPLFTRTAGLAWNHDFPLLLALLAFLALRRGLRGGHAGRFAALAGGLMGLSITSRLTFAPALAGFVVLIGAYPRLTLGRRAALLALFGSGFLVAALPSVWVWMQAPANAWFGNFLYPKLNTEIHRLQEKDRPLSTPAILWFYLKTWVTLPGSGAVTLGFLWLMAVTFRGRQVRTSGGQAELAALLTIVVLLIASGFMPAPPYVQYFYAATPFMILGIALCLRTGRWLRDSQPMRVALLAVVAICAAFALPSYRGLVFLPRPSRWTPIAVHQIGVHMAATVGSRTVLTIEPIFPLEGGLDVDPRFATGRFGVRVASLLSPAKRRQYLMPTVGEMAGLLDDPSIRAWAVVAGSDWRTDRPLTAAAQVRGFRQVVLPGRGSHVHPHPEVWIRP